MNNENLCYEGEIWKDIKNYEGLYQVSNYGRIKSLFKYKSVGKKVREKILKQYISKPGYLGIAIQKNKKLKSYRVHRLVGIAFVPNPNNLPQVNHKNGIKSDNRVENLEWCNNSYNQKHAFRLGLSKARKGEEASNCKITKAAVLKIRELYSTNQYTREKLSSMFSISCTQIGRIIHKEAWKHI